MADDNILYDVKRWPALMYKLEKKQNAGIRKAENKGFDKSTRWSKVMQEGFSCLLDPQTKKLEDPPKPGYAVEQTALNEMTALQEFKSLQQYTEGDEVAAGNAITALSNAIADKLVHRESNQDVDKLKEDVETLEELKEQGVPVEKELKEAKESFQATLKEQEELAAGIDPVGVRVAVRNAAKESMEQIENEREAIRSVSWGTEPGEPVHKRLGYRDQANRLKNNHKLQQIAKEAGRQRALACQKQKDKSEDARVEVDSIETGDEISRLLGSELLLLVSEDEAEQLMFYQRYADKGCLQLKLSGKEEKQQGPIVFCVDTSGSQNPYEIMTKATVLAMLEVARIQKRSFGVVFFDSTVSRVDYLPAGKEVDTHQVMDLLDHWTAGGTNFQAALDDAVAIIKRDGEFKQADVVLVTDGYCNTDPSWDEAFKAAKTELGFTVYTVLTNSSYKSTINKWSDQVWEIGQLMQGTVQDKIYGV